MVWCKGESFAHNRNMRNEIWYTEKIPALIEDDRNLSCWDSFYVRTFIALYNFQLVSQMQLRLTIAVMKRSIYVVINMVTAKDIPQAATWLAHESKCG